MIILIMIKLPLILAFFIVFAYGCGKEENLTEQPQKITAQVYKIEEPEAEEERENITTVRLCHDTDNGITRWINGSVFGFYDNATRFEFNDYCISNNYLMEFYCENEIAMQKVFLCKSGCVDNHCA